MYNLKQSSQYNFVGRHVLLDVQTASLKGITDKKVIYDLLEGLAVELDMTLVYPPLVAQFPFANQELNKFVKSLKNEGVQAKAVNTMEDLIKRRAQEESGVSGTTVWLESHAAIHTWTEKNFFSFDAYSCKDFDVDKAVQFVLSYFDVTAYNGLDILRTIHAPQEVRVISNENHGACIKA
ncbi:MAG: S-adenosylmethionine decarboxylase [Mariprofundaceae bacterium]|nr:S-adenosylmethionine decarboxylase [Mariprofundaceae bacterium]